MSIKRVFLLGLSGTGKSSVAPLVARRLGFESIDTDEMVERLFDSPVPTIFSRFGESVFRAAERECVAEAARRDRVVVATGGGVVLDDANRAAMRPSSVIVHLSGSLETIGERLAKSEANPYALRPLLAGGDPVGRLGELWSARRLRYAQADVEIDTTGKSLDEVAAEIEQAVIGLDRRAASAIAGLATGGRRSDLYVGEGLLEQFGALVRSCWPEARRVWLVSDSHVAPLWSRQVVEAIAAENLVVEELQVPAGETSKSLPQVERLLDQLIEGRVDRRDVVVALGGGVVGDLAGFVSSIALRGIGLAQFPTSLLAMVDSSVGGKTGIDHRLGKNLIGTFYQPELVVADPRVLRSLPPRELRAGWAEIVKHAMIECSATAAVEPLLLCELEARDDLLALDDLGWLAEMIRHNILLKATVVQTDEREAGPRRLLNYGHTLGHAMEAAGYRYLHGEAVALGMRGVVRLAQRLGFCGPDLVERQDALLDRLGLPAHFEGRWSEVVERMVRDKKAVHGALTWIVPRAPGQVTPMSDLPMTEVEAVARALGAE